jgi:argininosuccinate lyase
MSIAHLLLAYYTALRRDRERLDDYEKRLEEMPLGSGAIGGSSIGIDRKFLMKELGFNRLSRNSIDAVSARDFIAEFQFICTCILVNLSRISEDLVFFTSDEIGFMSLPDGLSTTSSLMPQKKNPDSLELIRGKASRVIGNLVSILTLMKGLPYTYNRDLQEDKEALFDTADNTLGVINVMREVIQGLTVNKERIAEILIQSKGFLFATDIADYLVRKGVVFRKAHKTVGSIVRYALEKNKSLQELVLDEFKNFDSLFDQDVFEIFGYEKSVNSHDVFGGTALRRIEAELKKIEEELKKD